MNLKKKNALKMLIKKTDIKIVRQRLEERIGKERLEKGLMANYESDYKQRGLSYEEAEPKIMRFLYKIMFS